MDANLDWKSILEKNQPPRFPPSGSISAASHSKSSEDGVSQLFSRRMMFELPDFTEHVKERQTDLESCVQELVLDSLALTIPYYVGPFEISSRDLLFPSGDLANQLGCHVSGVTGLYAHIGGRGSGTAFHCEDGQMRSYNLNVFGEKLWILIDCNHTSEFEALVRRLSDCGNCDQFVRHCNLLIMPARLRKESIKFEPICAGPGDMVLTKPRQYHAVINLSASFAIATNFVLPGENAFPTKLFVCSDDGCGLRALNHPSITPISSTPKPKSDRKRKRGRPATKQPISDRPNVKHLAACTWSHAALLHFVSLVREWRRLDDPIKTQVMLAVAQSDLARQAHGWLTTREICSGRSQLYILIRNLSMIRLTLSIEKEAEQQGRRRADSQVIRQLTKTHGQTVKPTLMLGRKLINICGAYEGLLCFIPSTSLDSLYKLSEDDTRRFHDFLSDKRSLHKLGDRFLQSILGGTDFPQQVFEGKTLKEVERLSAEELLRLISLPPMT